MAYQSCFFVSLKALDLLKHGVLERFTKTGMLTEWSLAEQQQSSVWEKKFPQQLMKRWQILTVLLFPTNEVKASRIRPTQGSNEEREQ